MIRTLIALTAFWMVQDPPKSPETKKADTEAEAFLKKVEEKATKAKTLKCKSKLSFSQGGQEMTFDAESSVKGDKIKLSFEGEAMGKTIQSTVTSNGSKIVAEGGFEAETKTMDAPKDLGEGVRLTLVRMGAILTMFFSDKKAKDADFSMKDLSKVSDVKFGKEEKVGDRACKVLTFTINVKDEEKPANCKLWVDATTLAPVKRELEVEEGHTITETFSDWKLDEELKDSLFELPKEKKDK